MKTADLKRSLQTAETKIVNLLLDVQRRDECIAEMTKTQDLALGSLTHELEMLHVKVSGYESMRLRVEAHRVELQRCSRLLADALPLLPAGVLRDEIAAVLKKGNP